MSSATPVTGRGDDVADDGRAESVFDVVVSTAASWIVGSVLALLIAALWVISPLIYRHRNPEDR